MKQSKKFIMAWLLAIAGVCQLMLVILLLAGFGVGAQPDQGVVKFQVAYLLFLSIAGFGVLFFRDDDNDDPEGNDHKNYPSCRCYQSFGGVCKMCE